MAGINKVILLGNLTRDAETLGENAMKFSIATSEKYKDREGNQKEQTEFHNCIAKKTGVFDYLKKGTQVYAEGKISTTKKDDKVYTNIRVFSLQLVGGKKQESSAQNNHSPLDVSTGGAGVEDYLPF